MCTDCFGFILVLVVIAKNRPVPRSAHYPVRSPGCCKSACVVWQLASKAPLWPATTIRWEAMWDILLRLQEIWMYYDLRFTTWTRCWSRKSLLSIFHSHDTNWPDLLLYGLAYLGDDIKTHKSSLLCRCKMAPSSLEFYVFGMWIGLVGALLVQAWSVRHIFAFLIFEAAFP